LDIKNTTVGSNKFILSGAAQREMNAKVINVTWSFMLEW